MSSKAITTSIPHSSGTDAEALIAEIRTTELPERVVRITEDYDRTIGVRTPFVWRWIYSLFPEFTLSCVAPEHEATVRETKTLLTVYITTLDDIAENDRDEATFEAGRRLPFSGRPEADEEVNADALAFLGRVWDEIEDGIEAAPRHGEFADLFGYDLRQALNAMRYSLLVSEHPEVANLDGSYHYGQHNMMMFPYANVDVLHSPGFDPCDLSALRRTIWDLQPMARIGNWVTTWKREVREGDYSSGVVVSALDRGILDPDDLDGARDPDAIIERIDRHGIEESFLAEWRETYERLRERPPSAESVDLSAFIEGMRTVMTYHLASRGYK